MTLFCKVPVMDPFAGKCFKHIERLLLMYILYPQDKLLVFRHSLQTLKGLMAPVVPYPGVLLDRCQRIPLLKIPIITWRNCPECMLFMPSPAERGPDKVFSIAYREDNFYFRVEQIKGIDKIYIEVGRIDKGFSVNPLVEIQHRHNPLFNSVEGVSMRVSMLEILIEEVMHPELMVSAQQLRHAAGP